MSSLSRQETRKEYDKWEMRAKIMNLCLQKQEKIWEWEMIIICEKLKKTMRRKIKTILINIWFNYSFDSSFRLKMLSWSPSFICSIWSRFLRNGCNLLFYNKFC